MYLTRAKTSRNLPVPRKGTKYIARALSHTYDGVSVVVAIRDMLKLAKNSKEVKKIVNGKKIKVNGKIVKDIKEGIRLFNLLEVDKKYKLIILPTRRFQFDETKDETRLCKTINKRIVKGNRIQFNFHDGTNILSKEKINVGDSVELDMKSKIKKVIPFEKGKKGFVFSGKSAGHIGKIKEIDRNKTKIEMGDKTVEIDSSRIIVL